MFRICFGFYVYLIYLVKTSSANYQYFGVQNVRQMESPSLEITNSIAGGGDGMDGGGNIDVAGVEGMGGKSNCNKGGGGFGYNTGYASGGAAGWQQGAPYGMASVRGMKKKCKKPKNRAFDQEPMVTPNIMMVERKREESPLKVVKRVHMNPDPSQVQSCEKDLKPHMRERIETYTETYIVTSIAYRTRTRRRLFVQKRKIVNQRMNEPLLIIRRKIIKERQIFERIIPKVIETREVINKPSFKSRVVEGPIYEITTHETVNDWGMEGKSKNIPEVEFDPES